MFEASARHLNFTQAANEFNVTQSAVSRMIKRLEVHLGTSLFRRTPKGLELTDEGLQLFKAVRQGFRIIEAELDDLRTGQGNAHVVTLSLSSAFAMHWFVPMVDKFRETFPEIDLRLQIVKGEPVGPFEDVDLAIRHNHPPNADQHSWKLMDEIIIPVCSSDYLARHGPLDAAPGELPHTFANLSGQTRLPWPTYADKTAMVWPANVRHITFSDYALVVQAALKGRAIALGWLHVVGHEMLQEGLVRAGPQELRTGFTYDIVATTSRPLRQPALLVKDWIVSSMTEMEERLSAVQA